MIRAVCRQICLLQGPVRESLRKNTEGRVLKHTPAVFSNQDELKIRAVPQEAGAGDALKLAFGRGCDRKKAVASLRYHITAAHSSQETDAVFMERIGNCRFPGPCRVSVTGTGLMPGKEESPVFGLEISPSAEYLDMCGKAGKVPHREAEEYPHIILAVSKESENPLDVCFHFSDDGHRALSVKDPGTGKPCQDI